MEPARLAKFLKAAKQELRRGDANNNTRLLCEGLRALWQLLQHSDSTACLGEGMELAPVLFSWVLSLLDASSASSCTRLAAMELLNTVLNTGGPPPDCKAAAELLDKLFEQDASAEASATQRGATVATMSATTPASESRLVPQAALQGRLQQLMAAARVPQQAATQPLSQVTQMPSQSALQDEVQGCISEQQVLPRVMKAVGTSLEGLLAGHEQTQPTSQPAAGMQSQPADQQLQLVDLSMQLLKQVAEQLQASAGASSGPAAGAGQELLASAAVQECLPELVHRVAASAHLLMQPSPASESYATWHTVLGLAARPAATRDQPAAARAPTTLAAFARFLSTVPLAAEARASVQGQLIAAIYSSAADPAVQGVSQGLCEGAGMQLSITSGPHLAHLSMVHVAHVLALAPGQQLLAPALLVQLARCLLPPGQAPVAAGQQQQDQQQQLAVLHLLQLAHAAIQAVAAAQKAAEAMPAPLADVDSSLADLVSQSSLPLVFRDMFDTDITESTDLLVQPTVSTKAAPADAADQASRLDLLQAVACTLLNIWATCLAGGCAPLRASHMPIVVELALACQGAMQGLPGGLAASATLLLDSLMHGIQHFSVALRVQLLHACMQRRMSANDTNIDKLQFEKRQQLLHVLGAHAAVAFALGNSSLSVSPEEQQSAQHSVVAMWADWLITCAMSDGHGADSFRLSPVHMAPLLLATAASTTGVRATTLAMCMQQLHRLYASMQHAIAGAVVGAAPASTLSHMEQLCHAVTAMASTACMVSLLEGGCPDWVMDAVMHAMQHAAGDSLHSDATVGSVSGRGMLWAVLQQVQQSAGAGQQDLWQSWRQGPILQAAKHAMLTSSFNKNAQKTTLPDTAATAAWEQGFVDGAAVQASFMHMCTTELPRCMAFMMDGPPTAATAARAALLSCNALLQHARFDAAAGAAQPFNQCDTLPWLSVVASAFDKHASRTEEPGSLEQVHALLNLGLPSASTHTNSTAQAVAPAAEDGLAKQVLSWLQQLAAQVQLQRYTKLEDFKRHEFDQLSAGAEMLVHLASGDAAVSPVMNQVLQFFLATHRRLVELLLHQQASAACGQPATSRPATVGAADSTSAPATEDVLAEAAYHMASLPLSWQQLTEALAAGGCPADKIKGTEDVLRSLFCLSTRQELYRKQAMELQNAASTWQLQHDSMADSSAFIRPSAVLLWAHHTPPADGLGLLAGSLHSCQRVLCTLLKQRLTKLPADTHLADDVSAELAVPYQHYDGFLPQLVLPPKTGDEPKAASEALLSCCRDVLQWCIKRGETVPGRSERDCILAANDAPCTMVAAAAIGAAQPYFAKRATATDIPAPDSEVLLDTTNTTDTAALEPSVEHLCQLLLEAAGLGLAVEQLVQLLEQLTAAPAPAPLLDCICCLLSNASHPTDHLLGRVLMQLVLSPSLPSDHVKRAVGVLQKLLNHSLTLPQASESKISGNQLPVKLFTTLVCTADMSAAALGPGRPAATPAEQVLCMWLSTLAENGTAGAEALLVSLSQLPEWTGSPNGPIAPAPGSMNRTTQRMAATSFCEPLLELFTSSVQRAQQLLADQAGAGSGQARAQATDDSATVQADVEAALSVPSPHPDDEWPDSTAVLDLLPDQDHVTDQGNGNVPPVQQPLEGARQDDDDDDATEEGEEDDEGDYDDDEGYEDEYEDELEGEDEEEDAEEEGLMGAGARHPHGHAAATGGAAAMGQVVGGHHPAVDELDLPQQLLDSILDTVGREEYRALQAPGAAGGAGQQGTGGATGRAGARLALLQGHPLSTLLSWDMLMDDDQGVGAQNDNMQAWEMAVLEELNARAVGPEGTGQNAAVAQAAAQASATSAFQGHGMDDGESSGDDSQGGTATPPVGAAAVGPAATGRPARPHKQSQPGLLGALSSCSSCISSSGEDSCSDSDQGREGSAGEGTDGSWGEGRGAAGAGRRRAGRGGDSQGAAPSMVQCSYGESGDSFVEQHWYYCYTCGLVDSKGCCSACARVCHMGHDLVYSAYSRFFCDCGAGAGTPRPSACRCLQPTPLPAMGPKKAVTKDLGYWLAQGMVTSADACWPSGDPLQRAWGFAPNPTDMAEPTSTSSVKQQAPSPMPRLTQLLTATNTSSSHATTTQTTNAAQAAERLSALLAASLCALLRTSSAPPIGQHAEAQLPSLFRDAINSLVALASSISQPFDANAPQETTTTSTATATMDGTAASTAVPTKCNLMMAGAGAGAKPASPDLLRLQRIVRVGNLDGRAAASRNAGRIGGRGRGGTTGTAGGGHAADDWSSSAHSYLPQEHAEAVENGVVVRNCVSLCSASGLLAVARGTFLGFLDAQQHMLEMIMPTVTAHVIGAGAGGAAGAGSVGSSSSGSGPAAAVPAQKSSYSLLQRHNARFTVLSVAFDNWLGRHLAVVGLRELQVWVVDSEGKVQDRTPITLPGHRDAPGMGTGAGTTGGGAGDGAAGAGTVNILGGGAASMGLSQMITRVDWLPGGDTWLAVTTPVALHVYDIARSSSVPVWTVLASDHVQSTGVEELLASAIIVQLPPALPTVTANTTHPHAITAENTRPATDAPSVSSCGLHALLLTRNGGLYRSVLPPLDSAPWAPLAQATPVLAAGRVSGLREHCLASDLPTPHSGLGLQYLPASSRIVLSITGASGCDQGMTIMGRYNPMACSLDDIQTLAVAPPADTNPAGSSTSTSTTSATPMVPTIYGHSPNAHALEVNLMPAVRAQTQSTSLLFLALQPIHRQVLEDSTTSSSGLDSPSTKPPPAAIALCIPTGSGSDGIAVPADLPCQPISLQHASSGPDSILEGVTSMACPATHQTLMVLACSKGNLYFSVTSRPLDLPLLEPAATQLACLSAGDSPAAAGPASKLDAAAAVSAAAAVVEKEEGDTTVGSAQATHAEVWARMCSRRKPVDTEIAMGRIMAAATQAASAADVKPRDASSRLRAGDASDQADTSISHLSATASKPPLPLSLLEKGEQVASRVTFGGDVAHVGGSEGVRRLLCDVSSLESYLEGSSRSSLKLTLKLADASLVIVGVKVLLGASAEKYVPTFVRLGPGAAACTPQLSSSGSTSLRRWHQLVMSAEDALVAHPEPVLLCGPTADGNARPRLHHLQIFALPMAVVTAWVAGTPLPACTLPLTTASLAVSAASNPEVMANPLAAHATSAKGPGVQGCVSGLLAPVRASLQLAHAQGQSVLEPDRARRCQQLALALLAPPLQPAAPVTPMATQEAAWQLLLLCQQPARAADVAASSALSKAGGAAGPAAASTAAADCLWLWHQHQLDQAAQACERLGPALGLPRSLLPANSIGNGDSSVAETAAMGSQWTDAHSWLALHVAATVLPISSTSPQHLVRWLLESAAGWATAQQQQPASSPAQSAAPSKPVSHPLVLVLGVIHGSQLASHWLQLAAGAPLLPAALTEPLAAVTAHCLLALHVAVATDPAVLESPIATATPPRPQTAASQVAGGQQALLPGVLQGLPQADYLADSPPQLSLPPFRRVLSVGGPGDAGEDATGSPRAGGAPDVFFGAIAAAAGRRSVPTPAAAGGTSASQVSEATVHVPSPQLPAGAAFTAGQLLLDLMQTGSQEGWPAQLLPRLVPKLLSDPWLQTLQTAAPLPPSSALLPERTRSVTSTASLSLTHHQQRFAVGLSEALVRELSDCGSKQLQSIRTSPAASQAVSSQSPGVVPISNAPNKQLGGLSILPACQVLSLICHPSHGSLRQEAALVSEAVLLHLAPACLTQLRLINAQLASLPVSTTAGQQSPLMMPLLGRTLDLSALVQPPSTAPQPDTVFSNLNEQALQLATLLLMTLHEALMAGGAKRLVPATIAVPLCAEMLGLLARLLPPMAMQHQRAMLQSIFCAGPNNRKASATPAAASTSIDARPPTRRGPSAGSTSTGSGITGTSTASTTTNTAARAGAWGMGGYCGYQSLPLPSSMHLASVCGTNATQQQTPLPPVLPLLALHHGQGVLRPALAGQVCSVSGMLLVRAMIQVAAVLVSTTGAPAANATTSTITMSLPSDVVAKAPSLAARVDSEATRVLSLSQGMGSGESSAAAAAAVVVHAEMPMGAHLRSHPLSSGPGSPLQGEQQSEPLQVVAHGKQPDARTVFWWSDRAPHGEAELLSLLCAMEQSHALHGARRATRRLLAARCGGRMAASDWRHAVQAAQQVMLLEEAVSLLAGDPHSWGAQCLRDHALSSLHTTATSHPTTWADMIARRPSLLLTLLEQAITLSCLSRPGATHAAKLLHTALSKPGTALALSCLGLPIIHNSPAPDAAVQAALLASPVAAFARACLLDSPDTHVRRAAHAALKALWERYEQPAREQLQWLLSCLLPDAVHAGSAAGHLVQLLEHLLKASTTTTTTTLATDAPSPSGPSRLSGTPLNRTPSAQHPPSSMLSPRGSGGGRPHGPSNNSSPLNRAASLPAAANAGTRGDVSGSARSGMQNPPMHVAQLCSALCSALSHAHAARAAHPLREIHRGLREVVDLGDSWHLEVDARAALRPRLINMEYNMAKLETLKQSFRYTANAVMASLAAAQSIRALTLSFVDARRSRCIAAIKVSYYHGMFPDLAHMKSPAGMHLWQPLALLHLEPGQQDVRLELQTPVVATAVCFEVVGTYSNLQDASQESLSCPRCSSPVTDRFGVCGYCGENAHQCRHCRNINYGALDGFLCAECGNSRYCRIDLQLMAAPAWQVPPLTTEEEAKSAQQQVESASEELARKQATLASLARSLAAALSDAKSHDGLTPSSSSSAKPKANVGAAASADADAARAVGAAAGMHPGVTATLTAVASVYNTKCKSVQQEASLLCRQLAGVRAALLEAPGSQGGPAGARSTPPAALLRASLPRPTYPAALEATALVLNLLVTVARYYPSSHRLLLSQGVVDALCRHDLLSPSPGLSTPATYLLLELTQLSPSPANIRTLLGPAGPNQDSPLVAAARGAVRGEAGARTTPTAPARAAGAPPGAAARNTTTTTTTASATTATTTTTASTLDTDVQSAGDESMQSQDHYLKLVVEARGLLGEQLAGPLLAAARNPGQTGDWRQVSSLVQVLTQAARSEVRHVPHVASLSHISHITGVTWEGDEPSLLLPPGTASFHSASMLDLVLQLLHASTLDYDSFSRQGSSYGSSYIRLGEERQSFARPHGSRAARVSETVVQPLLRLLNTTLKEQQRQLTHLVACHVLRARLAAWHAATPPAITPATGPDLASAALASITEQPPVASEKQQQQPPSSSPAVQGLSSKVGQGGDLPEKASGGSPGSTGRRKGHYGAAAALPGLDSLGPKPASAGVFAQQQGQSGSPASQGHRSGGSAAAVGQAKTYTKQPWKHQQQQPQQQQQQQPPSPPPVMTDAARAALAVQLPPKPTLEECIAQVPDILLELVGTFMLDIHSAATRTVAVQVYTGLHAEKVHAAQAGRQGTAGRGAAAAGSRLVTAGGSSRAGLLPSPALAVPASAGGASRLQPGVAVERRVGQAGAVEGAAGAGGNGLAGERSSRVTLLLLEDLLDWLPAACAAGQAGEELLRLVLQDCVGAAASAGAYPLLARLLATTMVLLPRLVASLLSWEAPHTQPTSVPAGLVASSTGAAAPAAQPLLQPAGTALAAQQLVALLVRLLEYSELQGHLLTSPPLAGAGGPQAAQPTTQLALLVWSYAGLQALRLQRSVRSSTAESSLRDALTARFLKAGDDMRRTLIRACTGALAMTRQQPHYSPHAPTPHATGSSQRTGGVGSAHASVLGLGSPLPLPPAAVLQRMQQAMLQQVLNSIQPPKDEGSREGVQLLLDKAATQEEFIPGTMGSTPYKASDMGGPLMRDVKNFVCRRLDLEALVEDDFGMELLVAGNIVALGLPIEGVYQQVWRPFLSSGTSRIARYAAAVAAAGGPTQPPMVVTYRLSGLDGEATETLVKTLTGGGEEQQADPEREFATAAVLSDCADTGLPLLLSMLRADTPLTAPSTQATSQGHATTTSLATAPVAAAAGGGSQQATRLLLLRLLHTVAQLRKCRQHLLELGATSLMVARVHACMRGVLATCAAGGSTQVAMQQVGEQLSVERQLGELQQLLALLELLSGEATAAGAGAGASGWAVGSDKMDTAGSAQQVRQLADGLHALSMVPGAQECAAVLARVLPLLAHGNYQAQVGLLDHFHPSLDMWRLDASPPAEQEERQAQLTSFTELLQSLTLSHTTQGVSAAAVPNSAGGVSFRELLLQRGVPGELAAYLLTCFHQPRHTTATAAVAGAGSPHHRSASATDVGVFSPVLTPSGDRVLGSPGFPGLTSPTAAPAGRPTVELPSLPATPNAMAFSPSAALSRSVTAGGSGAATGSWMPEEVVAWCIPAGSAAFKAVLARPGVVAVLKLLVSMAQGHPGVVGQVAAVALPVDQSNGGASATAGAGASGGAAVGPLLPLLHLLEGVAGGAVVAPLAEGLLDALAAAEGGGPSGPSRARDAAAGAASASPVAAAIGELRGASQRRAKELAARRRQAMLSSMGMSPARVTGEVAGSVGGADSSTPPRWDVGGASAPRSPHVDPAWSTPMTGAPIGASTGADGGDGIASPGARLVTGVASQAGFHPQEGVAGTRPSPRDRPLPSPAGSQLAMELAALEAEEDGEGDMEGATELRCAVCREGYRLRPRELLCVYIFCKPLYCASSSSTSSSSHTALPVGGAAHMLVPEGAPCASVYSSVTHFNLIHASCHVAARAADGALRQPKREWDGACLRNGEVRCNNLLPVPSSGVSDTAVEAATSAWWDNLQQLSPCLQQGSLPPPSTAAGAAEGRSGMTRTLWNLLADEGPVLRSVVVASDLASLLIRFAARQSFSVDCGGGGRDSNACLVPCLMHHALRLHTHATAGEREQLSGLVMHHMSEGASVGARGQEADRAVAPSWPMAFALSLITHDLPTWKAKCTSWLQLVGAGSSMGTAGGTGSGAGRSTARSTTSTSTAGGAFTGLGLAPAHALRFAAIVAWLQQHYKGGQAASAAAEGQTAGWMGSMRSRLEQLALVPGTSAAFVAQVDVLDGLGDGVPDLVAHVTQLLQ